MVINYEGGGLISISINKAEISKVFSVFNTRAKLATDTENILVGTFVVTVTSTTAEVYTVKAFTNPEYVYNSNQFMALTDELGGSNCRLSLISNKNPAGDAVVFQLFNNSAVIVNSTESTATERQVTISTYILPGQIASLLGSTCEMPMFFKIEGA